MKKKPTSVIILFAILLAYIIAVIIIDPYNYFNTGIVNQDVKFRIAYPLNQRLTKIIGYKHEPSPNILIGDSRINGLNIDLISEVTGEKYFNFGYGACTVPETIDNFWFAAKQQELENVVIGISFSTYNTYYNKNIFNEAVRSSTLFNYVFNSSNIQVIYYMFKDLLSKEKIVLGKPVMDKEKYWPKLIINETTKFYKLYKYPDKYYQELKDIQNYCMENNINLTYFIPPTHIEVQEKIDEFSLVKENIKFKDDISSLGKLYDFNYDSELTRNKENFSDPFHFNRDVASILINIIFKDSTNFTNLGNTN